MPRTNRRSARCAAFVALQPRTIIWIIMWLITMGLESTIGFSIVRFPRESIKPPSRLNGLHHHVLQSSRSEDTNIHESLLVSTRRTLLRGILSGTAIATSVVAITAITATLAPPAAFAASTTNTDGDTIWLTGKAPKVPGQKPKDKSDVSGTRKDPKFLRSLADCKNQCENNTAGSDGYAKSKEDCLSECQDICCMTYEQCTFAIVPRM